MTRSFFAAVVGAIAIVLGSAPSFAQMAYITNSGDNTVSVIDTATNTVRGTIPVGASPQGVAVTTDGSRVYVTNQGDNTVSVIDVATNTVRDTIPLPASPSGVAVTPDGSKIYVGQLPNVVAVIDTATNTVIDTIPSTFPCSDCSVTNVFVAAVSPDGSKVYVSYLLQTSCINIVGNDYTEGGLFVIDTATNTVVDTIKVGGFWPSAVAVTPDGSKVYVTSTNTVAVLDTTSDTVTATIPVGGDAFGVAVSPDGSKVYVTSGSGSSTYTVSVIDTATNTAVGLPIPVGFGAFGIAITPDGRKVLVANTYDGTVSVIDTTTNTVVAVLPVGSYPYALGVFIQPRFAGTPGDANCHDNSTSALAQTFGGLKPAAIALGFPTVQALQTAVDAFCGA